MADFPIMEYGEYAKIIGGDYRRRDDAAKPPLASDLEDAAGYYGDQAKEAMATISGVLGRARDAFEGLRLAGRGVRGQGRAAGPRRETAEKASSVRTMAFGVLADPNIGRPLPFAGVSYDKIERDGSVQWPCNDEAPDGTLIMHIGGFVRGKGRFMLTGYVPTREKVSQRFPLLLTTGRILSQYNVGAQTRRTPNSTWHDEDRLEIHPHDAEQRGLRDGDWVRLASRAGETTLRAKVTDRVAPGVVYTTFHHPVTGANVVTTENSDWATNCPEYKVTAVQVGLDQQQDQPLDGRLAEVE